MTKTNELEVVNENKEIAAGGMDINKIMALAVGKGDLDKIEKMMELQERFEEREAKKAYHVAMTAFKTNPPKIYKDALVSFNNTEYKHAKLGNVTEKISTELSKQGLSAAWTTSQEKGIAVTCKITHIMGHSESTTLEAAADSSGGKNAIQAIGSTVTYLERYTLLALTGLATHEDDDGAGTEAEYIDDEQLATLNEWIETTKTKLVKFNAFMKVESLDKILAKDYNVALDSLKRKEKVGEAK